MNTTLTNSSQESRGADASDALVFNYSTVIILLFGIIGNIAVIRVFSRPALRNRSMVPFYISLSASTLMLTILSYSIPLLFSRDDPTMYNILCKWTAAVDILGCVCNSLTCVVMTTNYYISTVLGTGHRVRLLITLVGLSAVWTCSVCIAAAPFVGWGSYVTSQHYLTCHVAWSTTGGSYSIHLVCIWIYLPLVVSMVLYFYTRRQISRVDEPAVVLSLKTKHRMVPALCVCFYTCIIPYYTLSLATAAASRDITSPTATLLLEILAKSHVVFPPFVYHTLSASYRHGLLNIFSTAGPPQVTTVSQTTRNPRPLNPRGTKVAPLQPFQKTLPTIEAGRGEVGREAGSSGMQLEEVSTMSTMSNTTHTQKLQKK